MKIATLADFEASEFCRNYGCTLGESYTLRALPPFFKAGDVETPYNARSIGAQGGVTTRGSQVISLGIEFYKDGSPADADLEAVGSLLASTDQSSPHTKTLAFVKKHALFKVCYTCTVIDGMKIRDGNYDVYVAHVGQTVISLVQIASGVLAMT